MTFLTWERRLVWTGPLVGLVPYSGPTPLLSSSTNLEARMSIAIIVVIVLVLLSIGIKVRRGSFFWWSGKDGPNT